MKGPVMLLKEFVESVNESQKEKNLKDRITTNILKWSTTVKSVQDIDLRKQTFLITFVDNSKKLLKFNEFKGSLGDVPGLKIKESVNEAQDKFKVIDTKTGEIIDSSLPKKIAQKLAAKKKEWTSYPDREKSAISKIMLESVNEATIGITTDKSFTPKDLTDALDKAKVKYKYNRLSITLSVLDLDKKYFEAAKKVVNDLGLNIMMAKESLNERQILVYNEVSDLFDELMNKLDTIGAQTTDPKWSKALVNIYNQLGKVSDNLNRYDQKLGVIRIEESLNEARMPNMLYRNEIKKYFSSHIYGELSDMFGKNNPEPQEVEGLNGKWYNAEYVHDKNGDGRIKFKVIKNLK